jgi:hypothetical protein
MTDRPVHQRAIHRAGLAPTSAARHPRAVRFRRFRPEPGPKPGSGPPFGVLNQLPDNPAVVVHLDRTAVGSLVGQVERDAQAVIDRGCHVFSVIGASVGCSARASVWPTAMPGRRPPPARSATLAVDQWSRPADGFTLGVRPKSLKTTTIVFSSEPRSERS